MVKMITWDLDEKMGAEKTELLNKFLSETKNGRIYWVAVFGDYNTLIVARAGLNAEQVNSLYHNYFIEADEATKETIFEVTGTATGQIRYLVTEGKYAEFEGEHVRCLCTDEEWNNAKEVEKVLYWNGTGDNFREISGTEKDELLAKRNHVFVKITDEN